MERSGQDFPMLPAAYVHTLPFVLAHGSWQLLELWCIIIFFPLMFLS